MPLHFAQGFTVASPVRRLKEDCNKDIEISVIQLRRLLEVDDLAKRAIMPLSYSWIHLLTTSLGGAHSVAQLGGVCTTLAGRAADPHRLYPCDALLFEVKNRESRESGQL